MVLNKITQRFQLKFRDRVIAAKTLSEILKTVVRKYPKKDILVLGIPRAGVLTADIVATKLNIPNFDIVIPRKLTCPDNKEQSIGAVMEDGYRHIIWEFFKDLDITFDYLEKETAFQIEEINRRNRIYDKITESHSLRNKIAHNNTKILVDDGICTGATVKVTAKWTNHIKRSEVHIKQSLRLIIATPIVPKNMIQELKEECNAEVVAAYAPSPSNFHSVEQYHQNFEVVTDEQVIKILKKMENFLSGMMYWDRNQNFIHSA